MCCLEGDRIIFIGEIFTGELLLMGQAALMTTRPDKRADPLLDRITEQGP